MSKNFNSSMPNYISSFPLTKNKKLVDTEPMWIIKGLKHKKIGAEMSF